MKRRPLLGTIGLLFVAVLVAASQGTAYAHYTLRDSRTGVNALFHVSPDDDPIAGEQSIISFDFSKDGIRRGDYDFALSVRNESGDAQEVPLNITSNVILAEYTFPRQGLYVVALDLRPKSNSVQAAKLTYDQRVTRGTSEHMPVSSGQNKTTLIIVAFICMILLIVAFNDRQHIIRRASKK